MTSKKLRLSLVWKFCNDPQTFFVLQNSFYRRVIDTFYETVCIENPRNIKLNLKVRGSRSEVFCKKDVLKNFAKITGKHLFYDFCQVFYSNFFIEHLLWLHLERKLLKDSPALVSSLENPPFSVNFTVSTYLRIEALLCSRVLFSVTIFFPIIKHSCFFA